jgi:predicted permease
MAEKETFYATEVCSIFSESASQQSAVLKGLKGGLESPLLWGPILGISAVLAGIHLPVVVASCFELIGSTPRVCPFLP